jgi:hypothetical protein
VTDSAPDQTTDLLTALPAGGSSRRPPQKKKRPRRFRFSLNGLAIQLSAFALSFTLVALLVVSGSRSAFVEPNHTVTAFAAAKAAAGPASDVPPYTYGPHAVPTPSPSPSPSTTPSSTTPSPTVPPVPLPVPAPVVTLTDNAAGTALFGNDTLSPGVAIQRCIDVTYGGNLTPGPVVLYASPMSGDLGPYLDLTIDLGTAGTRSSAGCTDFTPESTLYRGTLADFAATHAVPTAGVDTWGPAAGDGTRSFRFSLTVHNDPAAAGQTAGFGFSWRTEVP